MNTESLAVESQASINIKHKTSNLTRFESFQKIYIYFWVFSLVGHYLEVIWKNIILGRKFQPIIEMLTMIAQPYGLGAIAAILLIYPLIKKFKLHIALVYLICVFVSGLIEYASAALVVLFRGDNPYWSYSNIPTNINGYTCLQSSAVFGLLALVFLYAVYPSCENVFTKLGQRKINLIFWVLFIGYIAFLSINKF